MRGRGKRRGEKRWNHGRDKVTVWISAGVTVTCGPGLHSDRQAGATVQLVSWRVATHSRTHATEPLSPAVHAVSLSAPSSVDVWSDSSGVVLLRLQAG